MIFSHFQTSALTDQTNALTVSTSADLGRSTIVATRSVEGWTFPNGALLTFAQINTINAEKNGCFMLAHQQIIKAEAFSSFTNRYYSLIPTSRAPSMLISGIPMHRIKDTTPIEDTQAKIAAVGRLHGWILDTATGLGYTAILAAQTAEQVITIELDPVVLTICRMNPWSAELFTNPKIHQLIGDSGDLAMAFPDESFSAIIHDPPTFSLAGNLYSTAVYQAFHRLLKPNGRLFHYIGNPESRYGASTTRGVVQRLTQAGFSVTPKPRAFGVLAKK